MICVKKFRDGIFALRTRRFGNVAELMVKAIYQLDNSTDLSFDKVDTSTQQKVEIKFSAVRKSNGNPISESNVIEQCLKAKKANRAMKYSEISHTSFDCNIQQIKTNCFDVLYYGLFFADRIQIYKMTSSQVKDCQRYSDKQHRNNKGEGQFHINNDTFDYHAQFKIKELTYKELIKVFQQLK